MEDGPAALALPSEIWNQIFDLASDEDVIFQYGLPTVMAESAWFKNPFGEWTLRSPQEAINLVQRRAYFTKKSIRSTCRAFRQIGAEFMYRCLFFNDPARLQKLSDALDASATIATTKTKSIGWWSRRLHLTRYYANTNRGLTMMDMERALINVIKHCPNLEIFIIDWSLGDTFGPVADALATYACRSLRTVRWIVPSSEMHKVIWALDCLPNIIAAHIEFEPPTDSDSDNVVVLGSASDINLTLPCLQQLVVRGNIQEFLEQATGWTLPSLRSLSIDCGNNRTDQPDVVQFLTRHGARLLFLDLQCIPPLDMPRILHLAPALKTLCFNGDWRLPYEHGLADTPTSTLVLRPHENIETVGLHGLMYAFGVGYAAAYASVEPLRAHLVRRSNDMNVAALNKLYFPRLQRVRALSRSMLIDLNREDGPSVEEGGIERWEKWYGTLERIGVRLEDCTGQLLGTLPQDEDEAEDEAESEGDSSEEEEEISWEYQVPPIEEEDEDEEDAPTGGVAELRKLLDECRAMGETREPPMFAGIMADFAAMYPGLPAASPSGGEQTATAASPAAEGASPAVAAGPGVAAAAPASAPSQ
ncbi:hypothetical protein K525DRAFT_208782 [Schizophyllum commune Loenen D]|nr:hypothetical protein K525DRAFT_208782 [Schizophyllum commune Loenen D]